MKGDLTPEEKLLRLIRGKKKQGVSIDKKSTEISVKIKPVPKLSLPAFASRYLSTLYMHRLILIAFVTSCIYLVFSYTYPWIGLRKIKLPAVTPQEIREPKIEPAPGLKPYEFYQEGIKGRQIFTSGRSQAIEQSASSADLDLAKDINLVGIISGENPQAVIEDKRTQKTYYVSKGEFIGQMQIEDIREGKIIINYKGQKYELYL